MAGPNPSIQAPSELLVPVKSSDRKWGYEDKDGITRIPPQFDWAGRFSEGLAPVEINKKFGYVDSAGKVVIALHFVAAEPFSEGLALVYTTWGKNILGSEGWDLLRRAGYVDHTGKFVIGPRFAENAGSFSEGMAPFKAGLSTPGATKWGYLDKTGKWALEPQFDNAGSFSEGLAPAAGLLKGDQEPVWGYIDHSGKFVIPAQFRGAMPFRNGTATVSIKNMRARLSQRTCIDTKGNFVACHPQG